MRREVPHVGEPPHVRFGRRVRELREAAGVEQQELARRVGMSGGYLSGIERGIRNPTLDAVFALAHALRVQPEALFQD